MLCPRITFLALWISVLACFNLVTAYPGAKSHKKGHTKELVPSGLQKQNQAQDQESSPNAAPAQPGNEKPKEFPNPKPYPESIEPQAVGVKVQKHPKKEEKEKEVAADDGSGSRESEELQSFPMKGVQNKAAEKGNGKKKYPAYQKLQGHIPIEGPPQYPPVKQQISPPLPATITIGKAQEAPPSGAEEEEQEKPEQQGNEQNNTAASGQEARPQQKSKVKNHKNKATKKQHKKI